MKPNLLKELQNKIAPMVRHMDETYSKYENLVAEMRAHAKVVQHLTDDARATHRSCQRMFTKCWIAAALSVFFFIITVLFT